MTLPPETRMGPVRLRVRDLEKTAAYYRDVLGFQVHRSTAEAVHLGPAGETLLELEAAPHARPRPPQAPGLYHVAYLLPHRSDLASFLVHATRQGTPLDGAADHLVSEALYLHDPEGNGIEVYADRPRDAWPRDGGAPRMATHPLDVEDLLRTARGAWWTPPPGTRVGHVHLQVSAVPPAEAFYRDGIGFDLTTRYGTEASFLSVGGYHHHVAVNTWGSHGAPPPPPGSLGLGWFTVLLPGRDALAEVATRLGAPVEGDEAWAEDPSGNRVRLAVK